jgi:hypothetical protein
LLEKEEIIFLKELLKDFLNFKQLLGGDSCSMYDEFQKRLLEKLKGLTDED